MKWAEKEAAVLKRSFRERPPDFTFTLRLVDGENTLDTKMADYLRCFTQRFRDFRKAEGATLEYYINIEFRHKKPHCHLTVITSLDWSVNAMKELVKGWWALSCPARSTAVYCDRVRNVVGLANYLPKHVKDRSRVEVPPPMWRGRRCRFVWRSRRFLVKSKERLWREQCAEWYPQERTQDSTEVAPTESPVNPPDKFWRLRRFTGQVARLRQVVFTPTLVSVVICPNWRRQGMTMARGP